MQPQPRYETQFLSRDGERAVWVEVNVRRMYFNGRPAVQGTVRDISERKLHEQTLAKALREKETLLQEVYYRLKSNLQVSRSLLELQGRTLPGGAARSAMMETGGAWRRWRWCMKSSTNPTTWR